MVAEVKELVASFILVQCENYIHVTVLYFELESDGNIITCTIVFILFTTFSHVSIRIHFNPFQSILGASPP